MDASRKSRFINAGKPSGIRVSFEFFPPKAANNWKDVLKRNCATRSVKAQRSRRH